MTHKISFEFDSPGDENARAMLSMFEIFSADYSGEEISISTADILAFILDYIGDAYTESLSLLRSCGNKYGEEQLRKSMKRIVDIFEEEAG